MEEARIPAGRSHGPMISILQILFSLARQNGIQRNVRRGLLHLGTTLILGLCIWGHVSELFDYWDNTFRTGNDIEYGTVMVALAAGAVICFAVSAALRIAARATIACFLSVFALKASDPMTAGPFLAHSPPMPLRI